MTQSIRRTSRILLAVLGSLALFATACGGSSSTGSGDFDSALSDAAVETAQVNEPQLQLSSNIADSELLDTSDGSIRTLRDVVTGDRPVLVWYWAPH